MIRRLIVFFVYVVLCFCCAVAAHGGIPKVSTYSVSKAALNACTKMHAYELKAARIRYAGR